MAQWSPHSLEGAVFAYFPQTGGVRTTWGRLSGLVSPMRPMVVSGRSWHRAGGAGSPGGHVRGTVLQGHPAVLDQGRVASSLHGAGFVLSHTHFPIFTVFPLFVLSQLPEAAGPLICAPASSTPLLHSPQASAVGLAPSLSPEAPEVGTDRSPAPLCPHAPLVLGSV